MKEGAVTYDEVVRAAIGLLREGRNISKPLVRERVGNRGSHSTIQRHLDAWRETLTTSDLEVLPPSMPPELMQHVEAFWNAATGIVEEKLSDEWSRAKASIETANQLREAADLNRDQWQEYAREKDTQLTQKDSEIVQYQQRLRTAEDRLRVRDQEYQGLLDRLDAKDRAMKSEREAMAERIDLLESRHQQELEAAESRWGAEREKLQDQAKAAIERAELEVSRSDKHEVYFLNEVAKARDETEKTRERYEASITRLEQELVITRRREESNSVRLGQMEERLMTAQDQSESQQADKEAILTELSEAKDVIARLEKENVELKQKSDQTQ